MVEVAFMAAGAAAQLGGGALMDAIEGDTSYPAGGDIEGLTSSNPGKSGVNPAVQVDPEIAIDYFKKASDSFESNVKTGLNYYTQQLGVAQSVVAGGYMAANNKLEPISTEGQEATDAYMKSIGLNALSPTRSYSTQVMGLGDNFSDVAVQVANAEKIQDPTARAAAKAQIDAGLQSSMGVSIGQFQDQQKAAIAALGAAPTYQASADWAFQADSANLFTNGAGNANQRYVDASAGAGSWAAYNSAVASQKAASDAKSTDGFNSTQPDAAKSGYQPTINELFDKNFKPPAGFPDMNTWLKQQGIDPAAEIGPDGKNITLTTSRDTQLYETAMLATNDYNNQMAAYQAQVDAVNAQYGSKISALQKSVKGVTTGYDMNYADTPDYFANSTAQNMANIENYAPWLSDFKNSITGDVSQSQTLVNNLQGQMIHTVDPTVDTLASTPGYQFSYQQGNQAAQAAGAAGGMLGSGNTMAAVDKYSQGLAQQVYQNEYNNFLQGTQINNANQAAQGSILSGMASQSGALANAYGTAQNNYMTSLQSLMSAGNQATGQESANMTNGALAEADLTMQGANKAYDTFQNIGQVQYQSLTNAANTQNSDNLANMKAQNDMIMQASAQNASASAANAQNATQNGYLNLASNQQQQQSGQQQQQANSFYSNYNT